MSCGWPAPAFSCCASWAAPPGENVWEAEFYHYQGTFLGALERARDGEDLIYQRDLVLD